MKTLLAQFAYILIVMVVCSSALGKPSKSKKATTERANIYTEAAAPRLSSSVKVNLYPALDSAPQVMADVVIADLFDKDAPKSTSTTNEPLSTEKSNKSATSRSSSSDSDAVSLRRFFRIKLYNIRSAQQNLILYVSYSTETTTVSKKNKKAGKPKHNEQNATETVETGPLQAGQPVIIDTVGFHAKTGSSILQSSTFTSAAHYSPANITSMELKVTDANGVVVYKGAWPQRRN